MKRLSRGDLRDLAAVLNRAQEHPLLLSQFLSWRAIAAAARGEPAPQAPSSAKVSKNETSHKNDFFDG